MVRQGRVRIDGVTCADPYAEYVTEGLIFSVDAQAFVFRANAYLLLNKPGEVECSHKPKFYRSVYTLFPLYLLTRGIQAVGRLDADTTGLLLFSDDGQFIHTYTSPKKRIAKTYDVTVKHPLAGEVIEALLSGVQLVDETAPIAAAACAQRGEHLLRMSVTEGKYHLVKRMVAAAGNRVVGLNRVSVGGLVLPGDLPPGHWRWLEDSDLEHLAEPEMRCD